MLKNGDKRDSAHAEKDSARACFDTVNHKYILRPIHAQAEPKSTNQIDRFAFLLDLIATSAACIQSDGDVLNCLFAVLSLQELKKPLQGSRQISGHSRLRLSMQRIYRRLVQPFQLCRRALISRNRHTRQLLFILRLRC